MKFSNTILGKAALFFILAASFAYAGVSLKKEPNETALLHKSVTGQTGVPGKEVEISNFDATTFVNSVEERLNLKVYAAVPLEGQNLHTVFTPQDTFTIDTDVTIALKGKIIDLRTGENILVNQLKLVESEIGSKLERSNAIAEFTSRIDMKHSDTNIADNGIDSQSESTSQNNVEVPIGPHSQVQSTRKKEQLEPASTVDTNTDKIGFPIKAYNSSSFDEDIFVTKVEEGLNLEVYATVQIEGHNLRTVFTTKGTFIIDNEVTIAFKGKVIDLLTGENILSKHLKLAGSEIERTLEKRNAIAEFTKRSHVQQISKSKAGGAAHSEKRSSSHTHTDLSHQNYIESHARINEESASRNRHVDKLNGGSETADNQTINVVNKNKVVELSDDAFHALKKQIKPINMAEVIANQKARQYPGTQELIKRQSEAKEIQRQTSLAESKVNTMAQVPSDQVNRNSIMTMLKNLPTKLRGKHGPKFAPKILPNISDEQFIVYEPTEGVEYRGTLTVATDFSCYYCQRFHRLIPGLNDEGVRVRYMPYSRNRIINYDFEPGFTTDEYIARTKIEPLNQMGQVVTAGYCSQDNAKAYNDLFAKRSLSTWPSEISPECEAIVREFKILGDLLYSGNTPYIVWGDKETPEDERGYIVGIDKHEKSIKQLLHRLES